MPFCSCSHVFQHLFSFVFVVLGQGETPITLSEFWMHFAWCCLIVIFSALVEMSSVKTVHPNVTYKVDWALKTNDNNSNQLRWCTLT